MNEETKENSVQDIRIVVFEEKYAESLADMWNVSKEEWGGQDGNRTADQIISSLRNEGNIKDFLALEGETVVGYCSFKEYEDDEGASYIPLLNVRPEYHGKKIGKKLLLRALEVAAEQQWPRMDLYTWSSNLKAVPLYKKCGFFWEKDNPYIHLMNFMPTVLNTQALAPYFRELDWYADVARELSVEPDGRVEKGFHFYEYIWKNSNETLRVEFCRLGRGLRLIDTKDYKILCYTNQNEFAYGKNYPVYYQIINKTDQPLEVQLQGRDDKNIRFSFEDRVSVEKEKVVKASFYVDGIEELYKKDLTHPTITTELLINGKKAEFRLGIVPKFPLDLTFHIPQKESFVGTGAKGFIDVENGFEEEATVSFRLQDSPELTWEENRIELTLKKKEKMSLPVFFKVHQFGFYQNPTDIQINLAKETMTFQKEVKAFIRGRRGKFYGATEKGWSVVNGGYKLTLTKHENHLKMEDLLSPGRDEIGYPKLGLPFGTDFSNKLPDRVRYEIKEDWIRLRAEFSSKDFPGITLHSLSDLFSDGTLRQSYELENTGDQSYSRDLWVSTALWHRLENAVFSYENELMELEGMEESRLVYYDVAKLTENWSYAKVGDNSWGIVWPKGMTPEQEGPFLKINENLGSLAKGEKRGTKPVFMLYNTMKNWQELRRFALASEQQDEEALKAPIKTFDIRVNENNPFLKESLSLHIRERKSTNLSGGITTESVYGMIEPLEKTYDEDQGLREDRVALDIKRDLRIEQTEDSETENSKTEDSKTEDSKTKDSKTKDSEARNTSVVMDTLQITADLKKTRRVFNRQVFLIGESPIEKLRKPSKLEKKDLRTGQMTKDGNLYQVKNGLLSFSADPDYSNGLCSIKVRGKEMLDSSYPTYASKFPWNPWAGGTYFVPMDYELESMLQQNRRGAFTEKIDSRGNRWEGIKISVEIDKIPDFKGLTLHQYILTLSGVPVISTYLEMEQETGKYLENLEVENMMFFRPDADLSNAYFAKGKEIEDKVEFKAGKYLTAHNVREKFMEVGSRTASDKVFIFAPKAEHVVGFTNKDMLVSTIYEKTSGENQVTKALDPTFMIFTENPVEIEALEDLKGIRF